MTKAMTFSGQVGAEVICVVWSVSERLEVNEIGERSLKRFVVFDSFVHELPYIRLHYTSFNKA